MSPAKQIHAFVLKSGRSDTNSNPVNNPNDNVRKISTMTANVRLAGLPI
ncbi:MAG: hypothetical protein MJ219_01080 [Mycoplasmoidaceae bacterium]|nr:hypothetical protein [Mycoplasmoidaceae bacterium]